LARPADLTKALQGASRLTRRPDLLSKAVVIKPRFGPDQRLGVAKINFRKAGWR
jgi:hypothetical protein